MRGDEQSIDEIKTMSFQNLTPSMQDFLTGRVPVSDKLRIPDQAPHQMYKDTEILPPPDPFAKPAPFPRVDVTNIDIMRAVNRDVASAGILIQLSDRKYLGYTVEECQNYVINVDKTRYLRYVPEYRDCDDFANILLGHVEEAVIGAPLGRIWYFRKKGEQGMEGEPENWGHAVNIGYDVNDKRIYCAEPQNTDFYRFNKRWNPWIVMI